MKEPREERTRSQREIIHELAKSKREVEEKKSSRKEELRKSSKKNGHLKNAVCGPEEKHQKSKHDETEIKIFLKKALFERKLLTQKIDSEDPTYVLLEFPKQVTKIIALKNSQKLFKKISCRYTLYIYLEW